MAPIQKKFNRPSLRTAEFGSQSDYDAAVEQIATEIIDEVKDAGSINKAREQAYDLIHENVDSSRWVFVTYGARKTLEYSKNEDAIFEQGDGLGSVRSMSDAYTQAAFWAMYADVQAELESKLDDLEEAMAASEDEEDEEDEE
jgi:hypothetical protein